MAEQPCVWKQTNKQTNDFHRPLSIIIYQVCFFLVSDTLTQVIVSPANWASKWAINWIYWPLSQLAALTHRCSWPFQSKAAHLQTGRVCDLSPARAEESAAFKSLHPPTHWAHLITIMYREHDIDLHRSKHNPFIEQHWERDTLLTGQRAKSRSVFFIKLMGLGLVWKKCSGKEKKRKKNKKSEGGLMQGELVCVLILNYSKMGTGHPVRHLVKLIGMFQY